MKQYTYLKTADKNGNARYWKVDENGKKRIISRKEYEANTGSTEQPKVVEFKDYEAFEESNVTGKYEVVAIVRDEAHGMISADFITNCKRYKTALRRFFSVIDNDHRFDGWKEGIEESCANGIFEMKSTVYNQETHKEEYDGGWHWCVDDNDGSFYVELTVYDDTDYGTAEPTDTAEAATISTENCLDRRVAELRELKRRAEEIEQLTNAVQESIKSIMSEQHTDTLTGSDWKITWKDCTKNTIDRKSLAANYPDIAAQYTKTTTYKRFLLT